MSQTIGAKDKSLEKTEPMPAVSEAQLQSASESLVATAAAGDLEARVKQCENLQQALDESAAVLAALRSDLAAQKADHAVEIANLRALLDRSQQELLELSTALKEEKAAARELKAQNLALQHILNDWGIPVEVGEGAAARLQVPAAADGGFFPRLVPPAGAVDPALPVLRGELSTFGIPDVLHFLSNANLQGVLTVVSSRIVSRIFLEKGCLEYAGWNNRDPDLCLARLLSESELVAPEALQAARGDCEFDFELAVRLLQSGAVAANNLRACLREHARVILGFLFHSRSGSFCFQPGRIERHKELEFRLTVTDLLLKTAAEMDEKTKQVSGGK